MEIIMMIQKKIKRTMKRKRPSKGFALILAMIFLTLFSAFSVTMISSSALNAKSAVNHKVANNALFAAQSGVELAKYLVATIQPQSSVYNHVTVEQANQTWVALYQNIQQKIPDLTQIDVDTQTDYEIINAGPINYGTKGCSFSISFCRYTNDPHTILIEAVGTDGNVKRTINLDAGIKKDNDVMQYAIASRGRMWVTGDSTIHGNILSSWDRADISPFNVTQDSTILGTVNTVLSLDQIQHENAFQLEYLDENNNPVFDDDGNRVYSQQDQVQGQHKGINYGQESQNIAGMDIDDYQTDMYKDYVIDQGAGNIPPSEAIETEYFPHASGDYSLPRDGSPEHTYNLRLQRHVYENVTFTDARLPDDRNALFRNCTFEGVLYIDCYKSGNNKYNNVRFENCDFNGAIVTDVPQSLKWKQNCLYFTGEAAFNNTTDVPATILAPHFNVNLGNTNPQQTDNNVLTGAIVGGIVDVRGNAQVYGTIISMCDTTGWSSGYVTNIGATLGDGGSETTELGDIGTIQITPDDEKMLPSGIMTPIVIKVDQNTYSEKI